MEHRKHKEFWNFKRVSVNCGVIKVSLGDKVSTENIWINIGYFSPKSDEKYKPTDPRYSKMSNIKIWTQLHQGKSSSKSTEILIEKLKSSKRKKKDFIVT